jgi:hypothetical protein
VSQQFLRAATLIVDDGTTGIDMSNLHFKFSLKQWDLQTPNTCQIRVYNVSSQTANKVQKQFSKIVLQAGYQGNVGTIFAGTLVQARTGRESPVDTYMDLSGADGDPALNYAVVSVAMAAGSSFADRVNAIAQAMGEYGVTLGYVAPLPSGTLPRGKTMHGMARDHLRDLCFATDTTFFITNGVLNIIPRQGALPGPAIQLNSATGMIGFPEQTEEGIQIRCLLNPNIKVGGLVQINNGDIQKAQLSLGISGATQNAFLPSITEDGLYRVMVCEHSGDTRGQEWYTDMICVALGTPTPQPLVYRGYS